jgi:UTP--glucose-1-phosphate uridylyltransferase
MVKKAVFVVAGYGTRFLPVTKTIPKEMLPIINIPIIHYVLKEAVDAGITDFLFITSRNKKAIEDYLDENPELNKVLERNNKLVLLEETKDLLKNIKISFVRQPGPLGTGDAVLRAEEFVGNDPFIVFYPDDVFSYQTPPAKQLIDIYKNTLSSVIALKEVSLDKVSSYGVVVPGQRDDEKIEIKGFKEKPPIEDAPSNLSVMGRYLLTPTIFECLKKIKINPNGEYYITDGLEELISKERMYGKVIKAEHFDTGEKAGYLKANIFFALQDEKLKSEIIDFTNQAIHNKISV